LSDETVEGLAALKNFRGDAQDTQNQQSAEAIKEDQDQKIEDGSPEAIKELLGTDDPEGFFAIPSADGRAVYARAAQSD